MTRDQAQDIAGERDQLAVCHQTDPFPWTVGCHESRMCKSIEGRSSDRSPTRYHPTVMRARSFDVISLLYDIYRTRY